MISTVKIRHVIVAAVSVLAFAATSPAILAEAAGAPTAEETVTSPETNETATVSTLDDATKIEIQRQSDELRNELRRQYLDDRAESLTWWAKRINWWLASVAALFTIVGIAVPIVLNISFRHNAREAVKEAQESADKASGAADKANELVKKIEEHEKQAKELVLNMEYVQTDRGTTSDFPSSHRPEGNVQNKGIIEEIRRIYHASSIGNDIDSALALQDAGETEKAVGAWRTIAIREEGVDNKIAARAWWSAGRITGNLEEQMAAYNRAIRFDPEFDAAYNSRGIAKGWIKQYGEAIKDFDKAIDINSQNADAYSNRGNAKRHLKKYESALDDLNEAILLDPKHVVTYVVRGNVKSDIEQYGNAIKDYDKAICLDPKNYIAYHYRANAKINLKQHDEAIKDYDEAIRLNPKNAFTYTNRGAAKAELKRYESAIEDFDEAIRLYPKDFCAYFNRGNVKAALDMFDEARSDLQTALKLAEESGNEERASRISDKIREIDDIVAKQTKST